MMQSGRNNEANEIVRFKRAAQVGSLMLGELNGPIEPVFIDQYLDRPRRELKAERDAIRIVLRGELFKFCEANFESLQPENLAKLHQPIYEHHSDWYLSLSEFETRFGVLKRRVLKGAPLHSTVHISPWGLQFESPESHLIKDVAVAFNDAVEIEESKLTPFRVTSWRQRKANETRSELAELIRRRNAAYRACVLSCFNLVEAYINGLSWDFVQTHKIDLFSKQDRNVLTESERFVSIVDKLIKIPRLITGTASGPLQPTHDPLKTFAEVVKPYRDAVVHASPFAASERFGGYDKLSKIYELDLKIVRTAVDSSLNLINEIHKFVTNDDRGPIWIPNRAEDGKFVFDIA